MTENNQDTLARAYATLLSLRGNIDQMGDIVLENYVHDYHKALDKLEAIGIEASEFCIPDSDLKPRDMAVRAYVNGERVSPPRFSKEKYIDKSLILTKLDAILGYFEIITTEKPGKMGFRTPDNQ